MNFSMIADGSLVAPKIPFPDSGGPERSTISVYEVQEGDTLSWIADQFGVSVNTILWANNIASANRIKIGDKLVILPVSGIKHAVKRGDTIESVAKLYKGDVDEIIQFNGLPADGNLKINEVLIIPDGEFESPAPAPVPQGEPDLRGYFLRPIFGGRVSRGLHGHNGVDMATSCGQPVFASADGTVILSDGDGWNGGYGKYVVVDHPNGTQTLYAHAFQLLAFQGQAVKQGQVIGFTGTTGNSTGCHLHFEVRGAKNPFTR